MLEGTGGRAEARGEGVAGWQLPPWPVMPLPLLLPAPRPLPAPGPETEEERRGGEAEEAVAGEPRRAAKAIQFPEAVPPIQHRDTIRKPFPAVGALIPSRPHFHFLRGAGCLRQAGGRTDGWTDGRPDGRRRHFPTSACNGQD